MPRIRLVSLSVFAALAVTALAASTASASIKYEWSVNGTGLAANRTILASVFADPATPTITFKSKVFGVKIELTSSVVTARRAEIAEPDPPEPGFVDLLGPLSLLSVLIVKPAHCTVTSNAVEIAGRAEIVEAAPAGSGKALLLFKPPTGSPFAKIKFEGSSCAVAGKEAELAGSVVAEPKAVGSGVQLSWLLKPAGTKSINSAGEEETGELTLSGSEEKVELTGSVNAELSTLQVWTAL